MLPLVPLAAAGMGLLLLLRKEHAATPATSTPAKKKDPVKVQVKHPPVSKTPPVKKPPPPGPNTTQADLKAAELAKKEPAAATPVAEKKPAKKKPAQHVKTHDVEVLRAQRALNALGAKLVEDGKFGPKTQGAWTHYAQHHKPALNPLFTRIDGAHARAAESTVIVLANEEREANARKKPAEKKATPAPVQKHAATPAAPATPATPATRATPPDGFDPVKAGNSAANVAKHLRKKGKANYSRDVLRAWQKLAGIAQDGIYGHGSHAALAHYAGSAAPAAFYNQGTESYPWG